MTAHRRFDEVLLGIVAALPFGRRLAALAPRLASLADQGVLGVANIALASVAAHALRPVDLAAIGGMLGIHFFVFSLHRGLVSLPFLLTVDQTTDRTVTGQWWRANLLVIGGLTVVLALFAAGVRLTLAAHPEWSWFAEAATCAVIASPFLMLSEFGRRWLYQLGQPLAAATAAVAYAAPALLVLLLVSRFAEPHLTAVAWAVGGLASTLFTILVAPPARAAWREAWSAWRPHAGFAVWQAVVGIPFTVYNTSAVFLFAMGAGPVGAAVFTAVRTLVNPATAIVSAVDSLDKPRAVAAYGSGGMPALRRQLMRTRRLLAVSVGAYLAVIALFAGPALRLVSGADYVGNDLVVRLLALATFLSALNQPSETFLIVLRASLPMLVVRLFTAVMAGVAIIALGKAFGPPGAAGGLVIVQVINLAALWVTEMIVKKRADAV